MKSFSILANAYQNLVSSRMKIYIGAEMVLMCKMKPNVLLQTLFAGINLLYGLLMTAHHSNATLILTLNCQLVIMVKETSSIARVHGVSALMAVTLRTLATVNQT